MRDRSWAVSEELTMRQKVRGVEAGVHGELVVVNEGFRLCAF